MKQKPLKLHEMKTMHISSRKLFLMILLLTIFLMGVLFYLKNDLRAKEREIQILNSQIRSMHIDNQEILAKADELVNLYNKREGENLTISVRAEDLSEELFIDASSDKFAHQISFKADVLNKMQKLTIGNIGGDMDNLLPYASSWVEIDAETIKVYNFYEELQLTANYAHGIEIDKQLFVTIKAWNKGVNITITSFEQSFTTPTISWTGFGGHVFAAESENAFTSCELIYYNAGYNCDVWAFGDSYFTEWPVTVLEDGYENVMFDGISGRQSFAAIQSLKKALEHKIPRYILWCMGMNDPDSQNEINHDWLNNIKELQEICEQCEVELILCTLPNTPNRRHDYKNEYIKNSGYRYVDLQSALTINGTTDWYQDYLSEDLVHPTKEGALYIAKVMEIAVPEMQ